MRPESRRAEAAPGCLRAPQSSGCWPPLRLDARSSAIGCVIDLAAGIHRRAFIDGSSSRLLGSQVFWVEFPAEIDAAEIDVRQALSNELAPPLLIETQLKNDMPAVNRDPVCGHATEY